MPPADPTNPAHERDTDEADEVEDAHEAHDLEALKKRADVPGLLTLAKAYRAGTVSSGRDMKLCLESYRAAADLGSAEAEYAVALFCMNGAAGVAQDAKEGATRLRSAAEKGNVPAKVYLGNLYELGIHYKADAEKANVWYRNAARAAHIDADPGSTEWDRALAELGCARHVVALTRLPNVAEDEKSRLLARAKAHGYGLRIRDDVVDTDRATSANAHTAAEHSTMTGTPPPFATGPRQRMDTSPETQQAKQKVEERAKSQMPPKPLEPLDLAAKAAAAKAARNAKRKTVERSARLRVGLSAFGYALLFALAGVGAGYAATLGARELVVRGHALPLIKTNVRLVFPMVLGVLGVLPAWLVYKPGAVLKSVLVGTFAGGFGWVAWGTGQAVFHADRPLQAAAFGLTGFLVGLLVMGLVGGAKLPRPS